MENKSKKERTYERAAALDEALDAELKRLNEAKKKKKKNKKGGRCCGGLFILPDKGSEEGIARFNGEDNEKQEAPAESPAPAETSGEGDGAPGGESLTEAKREVKRYYIRPQEVFCSNKQEILKRLVEFDNQNCSVYSLKSLTEHEKDVTKLTNKDIIYYYDDGILYDKNHVKVMDYDLSIKKEEERKKFSGGVDSVSDSTFKQEYEDRMTDQTVVESANELEEAKATTEFSVASDGTSERLEKEFNDTYVGKFNDALNATNDRRIAIQMYANNRMLGKKTRSGTHFVSVANAYVDDASGKLMFKLREPSEIGQTLGYGGKTSHRIEKFDYIRAEDLVVYGEDGKRLKNYMGSSETHLSFVNADLQALLDEWYGARNTAADDARKKEKSGKKREEKIALAYKYIAALTPDEFKKITYWLLHHTTDIFFKIPKIDDDLEKLDLSMLTLEKADKLRKKIEDKFDTLETELLNNKNIDNIEGHYSYRYTSNEKDTSYEDWWNVAGKITFDGKIGSLTPPDCLEKFITAEQNLSMRHSRGNRDVKTIKEVYKESSIESYYLCLAVIKMFEGDINFYKHKEKYNIPAPTDDEKGDNAAPSPDANAAAGTDVGTNESYDYDDENVFKLDFESYNAYGERVNSLKESKDKVCCICGEPIEGYGNNPAPYKKGGVCCDACNAKFVIPARIDAMNAEDGE